MAGAREIGIGIARVLSSDSSPDPFPLTFKGQSLFEAAEIISAVLAECEDANIALAAVELDPELFEQMRVQNDASVKLFENSTLSCEARFVKKK